MRKLFTITLLVGLFLLTLNLSAQDPNFYIYVCFGQSNMEGQGPIENKDKAVDERFKVFQALECSNLGRMKAEWYTAVPPTCQCWSKLSPADYFGRTMIANLPDSITVGIINVAIGGCDIRLFDKDIYEDYDSTYTDSWFTDKVKAYEWNPYKYLTDLAKLAQEDGVIKGILLHQGETNTDQNEWPSYVKKIYNDMLTDLSLNADSVPLLAGEVLDQEGACCASMNTIIQRLPDTIPTAHVISSEGLTGLDYAHFDSESYRKFGRRYAVQMLSLMGYEASYAEAECGNVGDNWYTYANANASNVTYIEAANEENNSAVAPSDAADMIEYTISVTKDTTYYLYGRFNNPDAESDAVWVKINNEEFILVNDMATEGWAWIELSSIELTAGEHSITIASAENGMRMDKIVLKNSQIPPASVGEEAGNVCVAELTPIIDALNHINTAGYALNQSFPNPATQSENYIAFEIPASDYVSLKLVNMQGQEIAELAGKEYVSGAHMVAFNASDFSPGVYFYIMKTDAFSATRKLMIAED